MVRSDSPRQACACRRPLVALELGTGAAGLAGGALLMADPDDRPGLGVAGRKV